MSFNIKSIAESAPEEGKYYLLDANVWKFILVAPQNPNAYERAYINFFEAIITLSSNPKCRKRPFIYINGLIFSEVYNAYMKSSWDAYKASTGSNIDFKQYRTTKDHQSSFLSIASDFKAYNQYLSIEIDLIHPPDQILYDVPVFSDYNDHYYFKIAQTKKLVIITNDGDFKYPGVEILTINSKLLNVGR